MQSVAAVASYPRPGDEIVPARLTDLTRLGSETADLVSRLEPLPSMKPGALLASERLGSIKPRFIVQGWAASVQWLADGRRQIFAFLLPGDAVGVSLRPAANLRATIVALTPLQSVDASPVMGAIRTPDERWSGLRTAVNRRERLEEERLRSQILRLGRQTAYERMCHLFLELRERLAAVGLARGGGLQFPMPLTQEVLADATGLSIVHVNRTLKEMRRDRLIDLHGGELRLLQAEAMETISDYGRSVGERTN